MDGADEPARGRGSAPNAAQKKVNEQTQQLLELLDSDTEHCSELDVFQIGKYLQREHRLTLSEEVIKHQCNQTFLENGNTVSRPEFVAFDKDIKTNLPELERNLLRSNFKLFEVQFTDGSLVSHHPCFLDRTLFTIGTFPRPHAFVVRSTPSLPRTSSSYSPTRRSSACPSCRKTG